MLIGGRNASLDSSQGLNEQLLWCMLELKQIFGVCVVQNLLQSGSIWLEYEKGTPKRLVVVIVSNFLLLNFCQWPDPK